MDELLAQQSAEWSSWTIIGTVVASMLAGWTIIGKWFLGQVSTLQKQIIDLQTGAIKDNSAELHDSNELRRETMNRLEQVAAKFDSTVKRQEHIEALREKNIAHCEAVQKRFEEMKTKQETGESRP